MKGVKTKTMTTRLQDKAYYMASQLMWLETGRKMKINQIRPQLCAAMDRSDYQANSFGDEGDVQLYVKKMLDKNDVKYDKATLARDYNTIGEKFDLYADQGIDHLMASDPRKSVHDLMMNQIHKAVVTYDADSFNVNQRDYDLSKIEVVDDPNRLNRERLADTNKLRISLFTQGINKQAKAEGRSIEDVQNERKQAISKLPLWSNISDVQATQQNETEGAVKTGYGQVIEQLGDYLSVQDKNKLQILLSEDRHYNEERLAQSKALLEHMVDNDIEYEVNARSNGKDGSQVELKVTNAPTGGFSPIVKLIDEDAKDDRSNVGSVYVGEGNYYYQVPYNKPGYMPKHPEYMIDMVMGKETLPAYYTSKEIEKVSFNSGEPGQMISYKAVRGKVPNVHPNYTQETADDKIDESIDEARKAYYDAICGPSLEDIDYALAEEQVKLQQYVEENEFDEDAITDALKSLQGEELGDDYAEGAYAIADHLRDMADDYVGVPKNSDDLHYQGKNPHVNFTHMSDLMGRIETYNPEKRLVNIYKQSSWTKDDLTDEDYALNHIKEELVEFNPATAHGIEDAKSDEERNLLMHVQSHLHDMYSVSGEYGSNSLPDVQIDDQGIIRWEGKRSVGRNHDVKTIHGEIGQVFLPDDKGILHTNFAAEDENFDMIPGIKGYFIHDGLDEGESRMERFRGEGFEQGLYKQIDGAIGRQLLRNDVDGNVAGPTDATMINKLYHGGIYGKRLEPNWYENSPLKPEVKDAIIDTLKGRVRLPNAIGHSANSFLEVGGHGREAGEGDGVSALVDDKNIRKLDDDYLGYFDMTMTGTNKSQGLVLYLADGAKLNHDGTVTPVTDENNRPVEARAKVRELPEFKFADNNPWDRNQMAANQVMTANDIAEDTHLMLATAGGWTFEDSCLVSKKWAEKHQVKDVNGNMRPLQIGDKISDFSGNKSTIGMIVDPDMDPDEAFAQQLTNEVDMFKQNPKLDVVMSPYSVISRQNSGIVKELVDSDDKEDVNLVDSNGETHHIGKMGTANMIVTDMLVDQKTHVYGHDAIKEGHGRKASSQLVWSMNELGLDETMKDLFKGNESSWSALREKLLATGLDMDKNGQLQIGYHPHEDEERKVFMPDPSDAEKLSDVNQATRNFVYELGSTGGLLQLPCEIKTGIGEEKTDVVPLMSAGLRRNRELINGETQVNDATTKYADMYKAAWAYQYEQQHSNRPEALDKYQGRMQKAYDTVRNDVIMNDLGGYNGETAKHSFVKEKLMSKRQAESATAVQTADPRLPLDTVKICPEIKETLNLKKNDLIMVERDPALRGSALVAMKWEEDSNIHGVAVNPTIAGMYDGDFDGDTLGCLVAHGRKAQQELQDKATIEHRLNDPGNGGSVLNASMDMVSAGLKSGLLHDAKDDEFNRMPDEQLGDLIKNAQASATDDHDAMERLSNIVVNKTLHNVNNFGSASIDITSEETAKESVAQIVATGAKGSPSKAQEFNDYIDGKKTLHDAQQVQLAAGAKSDGTGLAGANSQRLMSALRDIDPVTALEVTYPNTQAVLQVKHDSAMGKTILHALTSKLPNLFAGHDQDADPKAKNPTLSKTEWVNQMKDVYNNTLGLHGVDDHIEKLGDLMADSRGNIQPIKTVAAQRANLLDQWAYGGGFKVLEEGAQQGRKLTEGKNIQPILPAALRDKDVDKDIMLKKDVRKTVEKVAEVENDVKAEVKPAKSVKKAKSTSDDLEP